MSPPATLDDLAELVRQANAADPTAVELFQAGRRLDELGDAEAAAQAMVRNGLLTPYQSRRLLAGDTGGLRLGNHYRVLDWIGGGGMGRVFLCLDRRTGRLVAVKVLPGAMSRDAEAVARFEREARAATVLDHPAIVRAVDVGHEGWQPFLVLEFVDGADLFRYVTVRGPLEASTAASYVARAAEALQRAADQGWVHRDVKPHNLMVDRAGRLRVLDLGLARPNADDSDFLPVTDPTAGDALLGTADFIAPEQATNSSGVDGRADIYSLGATFYFLLTGRPPFPEGTTADKLDCHRTRDPRPISQVRTDVPEAMARVLARMMAKDPADRFQSPADVAVALAVWADPPPPPPDENGLPDWPLAIRRVLGLPAGELPAVAPSDIPALPSSFPRRATRSDPAPRRSLPGWVAVASVLVGLIAALLLAFR